MQSINIKLFIQYRDFYHFDNASIRTDFLKKLSTQNGQSGEFEKF